MTAANNSLGVAEFEGQTFLPADIEKFAQVGACLPGAGRVGQSKRWAYLGRAGGAEQALVGCGDAPLAGRGGGSGGALARRRCRAPRCHSCCFGRLSLRRAPSCARVPA
jgi:hypothetical protein